MRRLEGRAEALSARYRSGRVGRAIGDRRDAMAYLAQWMPATYAQVYGAIAALGSLVEASWRPHTILDLGSGPGTALWAVAEHWDGPEKAVAVERLLPFTTLGAELASRSRHRWLRDTRWVEADLAETIFPESDLVLLAHSLAEIPGGRRDALLERAWRACRGVLVLVEPGTPAGFEVVRRGREELLAMGADQLAPCPHKGPCPMEGDVWCHFPQRVARPRFQREIKRAELGWEDAKYAYVAVSRGVGAGLPEARLIGVPRHGRGRIRLPLCTPEGIESVEITRRDKAALRRAKKLRWGAALELVEDRGDSKGQ